MRSEDKWASIAFILTLIGLALLFVIAASAQR